MGKWHTFVDGEKVSLDEQNKWQQVETYNTIAERDTASSGWGSSEIFRVCAVVETGYYYYWNGAAWTQFPSVGGAGAPPSASFVTINAEAALSAETLHKDITGANLHVTKAHESEHETGGSQEIDVTSLAGVLADEQDAGLIKGKTVDDAAIGDGKVLVYKGASGKWECDTGPAPASHKATHQNGGGDEVNVAGLSGELADNQPPKAHKDAHKTGGGDAFLLADLLDAVARIQVKKNGVLVGTRRGFNAIAGSGVTLTVTDDPANEEVDVNIAFSGGGAVKLTPTYTIYKVGSTYYAMDEDGNIDFSGTDARTVIQNAIDALGTTGGWVHIKKAVYEIDTTTILVDGANINCLKLTGEGWSRATAADGTFLKLTSGINCITVTNNPQIDFQNFAIDCNGQNGHGIYCYPQNTNDYVIEGGWFNNLYVRGVNNNAGTYYAGVYIEGAMYWAIGRIIIDCNNGGHGIWINNPYADKSRGSSAIHNAYIRLYSTTGSAIKATADNAKPSGNYWLGWIELYGRDQWEVTTHYGFDLDYINHWTVSHAVLESLNKDIIMDNCKNNIFLGGYLTAGNISIDLTANANNNIFSGFWTWSNIRTPQIIKDLGTDNTFEDIRGGSGYTVANTYAASTRLRGIIADAGSDEPANYQTQTGAWAAPSGPTYAGRVVTVYNSTAGEYRIYSYANGGWRYVEINHAAP